MKDDWIRKPIKKIINVDMADVQLKSADVMNAIDELETDVDSNTFLMKLKRLKDRIKKYRQSGLDSNGGEFSVENLVFKILRNSGYLQKMTDMQNKYLTDELTLSENNA